MAEGAPIDVTAAIATADAAYRPIVSFAEWAPPAVDTTAWDAARTRLASVREETDPADVDAALQERLRAAAVDTGAIEGLYVTDRGFTLSVAQATISMDQAEVEKGADFRRNFEAQLAGFELALDVATTATPISEALIRRLHEVTCAGQPSHRVITPQGVQERELLLGAYKTEPNHVQLGDGSFHAYSPVGEVVHEMRRVVKQLRTPEFEDAHPTVQAAYAHHAFTSIHPFADGNGRVARLLASIWLLRAASIPLWIELTDRDRYLDALEAADTGAVAGFVRVVFDTSLRLLRETAISLRVPTGTGGPSATDDGAERLRDAIENVVRDLGASVMRSEGSLFGPSRPALDGLTVLCIPHHLNPTRQRPVTVLADDGGSADGRFRVVSYPPDGPDADLDELFAESEVVPRLAESATRRLQLIANILTAGLLK